LEVEETKVEEPVLEPSLVYHWSDANNNLMLRKLFRFEVLMLLCSDSICHPKIPQQQVHATHGCAAVLVYSIHGKNTSHSK